MKKKPHVWPDLAASSTPFLTRWRKTGRKYQSMFTRCLFCAVDIISGHFAKAWSSRRPRRAVLRYRPANHDANTVWPVSCNEPKPAHYLWNKTTTCHGFRHNYIYVLVNCATNTTVWGHNWGPAAPSRQVYRHTGDAKLVCCASENACFTSG